MKSTIIIIPAFALLFLTLVLPSYAVEPTVSSVPSKPVREMQSIKQEIKKETIEHKQNINAVKKQTLEEKKEVTPTLKQNRDDKKQAIIQKRQDKMEALYTKVRNTLSSRFELLTKIKVKIEARINEKATQGKDMTAVKTKLAEFDKYSTAYKTDLAAFDVKLQEMIKTEKPALMVSGIRQITNKIRADLNSMHKVLNDTIRLLVKVK